MKKITLFILFIIIGFSAVASHHKKKQKAPKEILSVTMRRTPCYGRCPDYTIVINKDGLVTYTGKRFVNDTGTFEKNVGVAKAAEVISRFNTYYVDTCKNLYTNRVADLPGFILTIQFSDHIKTINNANMGPYFLTTLAGLVDNAGKKTDNDGWQKVTRP